MVGVFEAQTPVPDRKTVDEFAVIRDNAEQLLGYKTAENLGILKIAVNVNSCVESSSYDSMLQKYPNLFAGIGLLRGKEVKLHIDPSVHPVCQRYRRISFGLSEKVEHQLKELNDLDIIEKVNEASEWVSPVVIEPKGDNDIRLCLDMRQANAAIIGERQPLPTVDEILLDLFRSNIFSKVDLKWSFHQLMLDPSSRPITTFATHYGLFRYKRLLLGVNAAAEIYQHEIFQVIQGLQSVANMFDNLVIHGPTKEEHDRRLDIVLERLEAYGLTLNKTKCTFGVKEIVFGSQTFRGWTRTRKGKNQSSAGIPNPTGCFTGEEFPGPGKLPR